MIYDRTCAIQAGGVFAKAVTPARKPRGHSNTSTSSSSAIRYTYNAAGDVVYDQDKGLTYSYNAFGLVSQVLRADGTGLQYRYAADGTLVTSTETQAAAGSGVAVSSRVFYLAGDRHDAMRGETYVQTPFGATLLDAGLSAKHVGFHADHLGNIILAYSDLNGDGFVDPSTEILEENRYYPYGLKLPVYTRQSTALPFAYNGAEEQNSFGLHLTTYRTMAPEVAFWGQVDPKAELMYGYSPYSAMAGNPILYNDPNGDIAPLIALAIIAGTGGILNLGSAALSGKVNSFGEGLSYFASGAVGAAVAVTNPGAGYAITVGGNLAADAAFGNFPDKNSSGLQVAGYAVGLGLSGLNATGAVKLVGAISPSVAGAARVAFHQSYMQLVDEAGATLAYVGSKDLSYEAIKAATGGGTRTVLNKAALEQLANAPYLSSKGIETGLTQAGRAVTKHPDIFGFANTEAVRQVARTDAALNQIGADGIRNLLANGRFSVDFAQKAGTYAFRFQLPSGGA